MCELIFADYANVELTFTGTRILVVLFRVSSQVDPYAIEDSGEAGPSSECGKAYRIAVHKAGLGGPCGC
jgi:hypothetical protein